MSEQRLTLTVEECAHLLGIGRQLAYEKVRTGEIPALRIGRRLIIPRKSLDRLLEQSQTCPGHEQEQHP